ncbi:aspartate-semialdehyde dehydrogenase [Erysipelotrichaceae bacterium AF15-26LB]|nr:aspartate-semialdehyde dehydrogenase [Erysipelotrichaceae bacterium 3_1_53]MCR0349318.1 aspartate-semialdehyde dehydrogenase [[Clostridium] innocuum]RJV84582.1 aspartate-semialdehyde dehydrogenase [Erysipelotrichaceae bacterium AF19-24AC]RJV87136.1 aspartate-semialdehyde dehydrogenase [Erysipelotrichaceae bacterium AF15-26LB]
MKTYKVAILGATGAVGQEMLKILMERDFPVSELHLLASARSAGKKITVAGKEYTVEETTENSFDGMDIVLGAAENDIAEKYLPIAAAKGAIVVDNSSAFRLHEDVPLIVPEVNPQAVREHHGIIANPNCATIIALVALQPLHAYANAKRMVVSTYQAVSGAGVNGIRELNQQVGALAHGKEVEVNTFQYQIAYNLIPQIGGFNEAGYSSEEMKMQNEGRKIMGNPELCVNCTCIRVPVIRSHSESIMVEFEKEISVEKARELLQNAPGVKLVDDPQNMVYPMPLDTTDQDLVYVGRIREDMSNHANALSFWCCGDQVRKGAATNAVQIAELVIQEKER